MKARRLLSVCVALVLLATVSVAAASAPLASPCMPGGAYDPACDVDHNGTIDIFDIQLTAGHWAQTGTYNIYPAMVPRPGKPHRMQPAMTVPQKGVAWPNPRFTDNGNGTVTDNLTGLIWLKNANCFGTKKLGDGLDGRQHAEQRRMWPDRWFGGRRLAAAQRARDAEPG